MSNNKTIIVSPDSFPGHVATTAFAVSNLGFTAIIQPHTQELNIGKIARTAAETGSDILIVNGTFWNSRLLGLAIDMFKKIIVITSDPNAPYEEIIWPKNIEFVNPPTHPLLWLAETFGEKEQIERAVKSPLVRLIVQRSDTNVNPESEAFFAGVYNEGDNIYTTFLNIFALEIATRTVGPITGYWDLVSRQDKFTDEINRLIESGKIAEATRKSLADRRVKHLAGVGKTPDGKTVVYLNGNGIIKKTHEVMKEQHPEADYTVVFGIECTDGLKTKWSTRGYNGASALEFNRRFLTNCGGNNEASGGIGDFGQTQAIIEGLKN